MDQAIANDSTTPIEARLPSLGADAQLAQKISSYQLVNRLVDAYFSFYHPSYPFIHEATFRAQYSEIIPRPVGPVWHMLVNTVCTLGAWCIGGDNDGLDDMCYARVLSQFQPQLIFETGSLPLLQVMILLSNYAQKRNKPNTGWNYLGLGVRMALSLGLHRELPDWNISLLEKEIRRRVWWGLFIFDSGASMTFGRTILLPGSNVDVKRVSNVADEVDILDSLTSSIRPLRLLTFEIASDSLNYTCSDGTS
jgi:transcriptional regulatory protein GAL4